MIVVNSQSAEAKDLHHTVDETSDTSQGQKTPKRDFTRRPTSCVRTLNGSDEDTTQDDDTQRQVQDSTEEACHVQFHLTLRYEVWKEVYNKNQHLRESCCKRFYALYSNITVETIRS